MLADLSIPRTFRAPSRELIIARLHFRSLLCQTVSVKSLCQGVAITLCSHCTPSSVSLYDPSIPYKTTKLALTRPGQLGSVPSETAGLRSSLPDKAKSLLAEMASNYHVHRTDKHKTITVESPGVCAHHPMERPQYWSLRNLAPPDQFHITMWVSSSQPSEPRTKPFDQRWSEAPGSAVRTRPIAIQRRRRA